MIEWFINNENCPMCRTRIGPEPKEKTFEDHLNDFLESFGDDSESESDFEDDISLMTDDDGEISIELPSLERMDLRNNIRREAGTQAGKILEMAYRDKSKIDYVLCEDGETRVVLDSRKSVLSEHENMVGNFTMELTEDYKKYYWQISPDDNSEYICAYHERKINNLKQRVFSRVSIYELRDGSKLFFGEITGIDVMVPEKQKQKQQKYQNPSKKMTKKMNFKYNRARNNYVGRRHIRA
jgi:hypothetical protein